MAKYNKKEGVVILVGLENDPRIPITEVMKAGYFIEDDQFHPLMNEWKVIIRRSSDNSIVTEEEVFDALAPKPVAVASTASATNGNKADPFGPQMPVPSLGIPVLGSLKAPNKPDDQATSATPKIGIPKLGGSVVPAAAQPTQQTAAAAPPPPQPKVEVDYERIATIIASKIAAERQEIVRLVRLDLDPISRSDRSILAHFAPDDGQGNAGTVTTIHQLVKSTNDMVTEDRKAELELQYKAGAASRQQEISDLLKTIEDLENKSSHSWGSFLWGYAFSLLTIVIIPVVVYLLLMLAGRV